MNEWAAKRFWKEARVEQIEPGFTVSLDGRAVKTPLKSALVVPSEDLAAEIAAEWDAQEELINPLTMPATRFANAAIDKVSTQHTEVATMLAAYGETDLLCYRAQEPAGLIKRQEAAWDPLLDWAHSVYDARLRAGHGVMFVEQDPEALTALSQAVHAHSSFALAALHDLISLSGSLVIGLAAAHRHKSVDDLWAISRIDEDWQIEQWGDDEEASALAETKRVAFENASKFYHWVNL